jgi:short-subunit dehydrogenase
MVKTAGSPQVYLITGAASGLGRVLSLNLADGRKSLVLFDRNEAELEETAKSCRDRGAQVISVTGDVTIPADCSRFVQAAIREFQQIDVLVANAGVSMWSRFEDVKDVSIFSKLMEVNYLGAVYPTYYALPYLKASEGTMVGISSIQGKIPVPFHTGYVASKHALQGFCNALRTEVEGIGVNVLLVVLHWMTGTKLREHAFGQDGKSLGQSRTSHSSESVSVDSCSKAIIKAIDQRRRELVIPPKLRALPWLALLSPRLVDYLVSRKVREQSKE